MTVRLAIAGAILAALIVVAAVGSLLDRQARRAAKRAKALPAGGSRFALGGPLPADGAVVVGVDGGLSYVVPLPVIEAHEVRTDALGEWEPTRHQLERAAIADRLLVERPWPNLMPQTWSAWTDAHPVVRAADLDRFGAIA